MPTNLSPDYLKVEKRYRAAASTSEKIECLEQMLQVIPKHKGTDHLCGDLRKRLSKLRSDAQSSKGASRFDSVFNIPSEGAGQVVIVGATNTGKSTLVKTLTNADPEVSPVPFTTWTPTPGMMPFENIQIQLIDTPPLDRDYVDPALLDLIRRADMLLLMVDLHANPVQQLHATIAYLKSQNIIAEHQQQSEHDPYRIYIKPLLVLANKYDDEDIDEVYEIFCELLEKEWPILPISALNGRNIERMQQAIFERLDIIRVFSKAPGREADPNAPFLLKGGSTVEDFAGRVHKDFIKGLKAARVWGSANFDGQMVSRDYELQDEDIVELRI